MGQIEARTYAEQVDTLICEMCKLPRWRRDCCTSKGSIDIHSEFVTSNVDAFETGNIQERSRGGGAGRGKAEEIHENKGRGQH